MPIARIVTNTYGKWKPLITANPSLATARGQILRAELMAMEKISILLVSDNLFLRRGLRQVLSEQGGFQGEESSTAEEAFSKVKDLPPHGVIIDADLPPPGGLALAARIRKYFPVIFTITLTSRDDDEELYNAIRAGCAAHLRKSIAAEELIATVHKAYRGEYPINEVMSTRPRVASRILDQFQSFALTAGQGLGDLIVPLNPREVEILQYVAQGNTNKRIALRLGLKEQSIKNYVSGILRKLAANDRAHAVFLALKHGWLKVS